MEVLTEPGCIICGMPNVLFTIAILYLYLQAKERTAITTERYWGAKADEARTRIHSTWSLIIAFVVHVLQHVPNDVIGIKDGIATIVNASACIGHGQSFMPALSRLFH